MDENILYGNFGSSFNIPRERWSIELNKTRFWCEWEGEGEYSRHRHPIDSDTGPSFDDDKGIFTFDNATVQLLGFEEFKKTFCCERCRRPIFGRKSIYVIRGDTAWFPKEKLSLLVCGDCDHRRNHCVKCGQHMYCEQRRYARWFCSRKCIKTFQPGSPANVE